MATNMNELSRRIRAGTEKKLRLFENIRGKNASIPFWNVVVLTACDEEQRLAYALQLESKLARRELPLNVDYLTISDPVGAKVGNGGATLHVVQQLNTQYGERAAMLKVLILHAGGYSQRLPNTSISGKIFAALPIEGRVYQMLELKLAMYIEFPSRMPPGIFVTSADTIELYELDGGNWTFHHTGITAIAHPSPIEIGTTHGVYVLDTSDGGSGIDTVPCRRFIHKYSTEAMRQAGAVFNVLGEEFVYSDSAYFMDFPTANRLRTWYSSHCPLGCEIDAYGDFLQALGPDSSPDYCENTSNVTVVTDCLVPTRRLLFECLKGTPLNVILLHNSKFYHVGTTAEFIHHLCWDDVFQYEMVWSVSGSDGDHTATTTHLCLTDVKMGTGVSAMPGSVIEHSAIGDSSIVGQRCIISSVELPPYSVVPDNTFLMTSVLKGAEGGLYTTVFYSVDDNLKRTVGGDPDSTAKYLGVPLSSYLSLTGQTMETLWADGVPRNLWHGRFFGVFNVPTDSVTYALSVLHALIGDGSRDELLKPLALVSMADILREKDVGGLFAYRVRICS